MKIKNILCVSVFIITIPLLVSCNKKESGLTVPPDTKQIIVITGTGEMKVIDRSGRPLPSCEDRKGSNDECKAPDGKFEELCGQIDINTKMNNLSKAGEYLEEGEIKDIEVLLCSFKFTVNPNCFTTISRITGERIERCY